MEPVGVVKGAAIKKKKKKLLRAKIEFHSHGCGRGGKNKVLATMARPSLEFHKAHVPFKIPLDR